MGKLRSTHWWFNESKCCFDVSLSVVYFSRQLDKILLTLPYMEKCFACFRLWSLKMSKPKHRGSKKYLKNISYNRSGTHLFKYIHQIFQDSRVRRTATHWHWQLHTVVLNTIKHITCARWKTTLDIQKRQRHVKRRRDWSVSLPSVHPTHVKPVQPATAV